MWPDGNSSFATSLRTHVRVRGQRASAPRTARNLRPAAWYTGRVGGLGKQWHPEASAVGRTLIAACLVAMVAVLGGIGGSDPDLKPWREVLKFEVTPEVRSTLAERAKQADNGAWKVQTLAEALGATLNCDYYPVTVNTMPYKNGKDGARMSPSELLAAVREALVGRREGFLPVDPKLAKFRLLDEKVDGPLWADPAKPGAVLFIDVYIPGLHELGSPDTAAVIVSKSAANEFYFSTIQAGNRLKAGLDDGNAGAHPVGGTRCFGYLEAGGAVTFYTLGADRAWGVLDREELVFPGMDQTWSSFQSRLVKFIKDSGGSATPGEVTRHRMPWKDAQPVIGKL